MLINAYLTTTGVGVGGGPSYFFEERFEGTGYQNTWVESGVNTGVCNEDYTTSPLEGSQSLLLSGTAQKSLTTTTFSSDQAELWAFFMLRIDTALSANRSIFFLQNSSAVTVYGITLTTANLLTVTVGTTNTTVDALVTSSNYNIWCHYQKGTGANAIGTVGFSTGTTEVTSGNAFASRSNGTSVTDAHDLTCSMCGSGTNTTGALVFDKILFSTTGTIGDNPA